MTREAASPCQGVAECLGCLSRALCRGTGAGDPSLPLSQPSGEHRACQGTAAAGAAQGANTPSLFSQGTHGQELHCRVLLAAARKAPMQELSFHSTQIPVQLQHTALGLSLSQGTLFIQKLELRLPSSETTAHTHLGFLRENTSLWKYEIQTF